MTTWVAVSFTVKSPDLLVNLIHFCCRHIALFTHIFGLLKPKSLLVIRILMVLIPILLVDNPSVIGYNYPNFATKTSPVLLAEMLIHQPFIRDIRYLIAFPFLRVKWLNIIHFVWETHTHIFFLREGPSSVMFVGLCHPTNFVVILSSTYMLFNSSQPVKTVVLPHL